MNLYFSKTHSDDEDNNIAEEGKLAILFTNKKDLNKVCDFFATVKKYINKNEHCHMHFQDSFDEWDKDKHIDIEINME